jgi:hypothetical protein
VCERRVNLLVYSLSLHRHSYIGFILAFDSSIHNKQTIINKQSFFWKKGTKQHTDGWDAQGKAWVYMVLHPPHPEGRFGVTFNDVTKDAEFHTTTSRFVTCLGVFPQEHQELWLSKDDFQDSSSWSSPPLRILRDIHSKLIDQYDCKEVCVSSPSQVDTGSGVKLSSQDGVSQQ